MSRAEAQKLFRKMPVEEKIHYACISITGTWDPPLNRSFFPRYTIPLAFDDIDGRLTNDSNLVPMSFNDAKLIADFAYRVNKDKSITDLVVHCDAGVSRSAGIANELAAWLGSQYILVGSRVKPNIYCAELLRKALQRKSWYELFNAIHSEKDWYPEGYDIDVSKPLEEILSDLYKQINERQEEQTDATD